MRTEIIGVEEKYKFFFTRFWCTSYVFLLLFLFISVYLLANYGSASYIFIMIGIMFLLIILNGLSSSAKILYKIYLDDDGSIEVETLHFNKIKKIRCSRKDVQVKVIQDATSRYIVDMIRIDIDKKTYFTQKQFAPWSREKIQQVKDFVKQGIL